MDECPYRAGVSEQGVGIQENSGKIPEIMWNDWKLQKDIAYMYHEIKF